MGLPDRARRARSRRGAAAAATGVGGRQPRRSSWSVSTGSRSAAPSSPRSRRRRSAAPCAGCTACPCAAVRAAGIGERRYGPSTQRPRSRRGSASRTTSPSAAIPGWSRVRWTPPSAGLRSDQRPPPRLTALGIADLNPANVLWDGTACRLVDFEDGGLTDPAFELADHVEHIAGRLPPVYDPDALVAAVGLSADDQARMRGLPSALGGLLVGHAVARQRWLPPQSARHDRSAGPAPDSDARLTTTARYFRHARHHPHRTPPR